MMYSILNYQASGLVKIQFNSNVQIVLLGSSHSRNYLGITIGTFTYVLCYLLKCHIIVNAFSIVNGQRYTKY